MIKTVEEFLAHAITLEAEAAQRFDELADMLEVHHNSDAVDLFRKLAAFSRKHLAEVQSHAEGMTLPHIKPWAFEWGQDSPEAAPYDDAHYLMREYHALQLALGSEMTGYNFYADLARSAPDPRVRELAAAFAEEESEHVALLKKWIERCPKPEKGWDEDPDPPVEAG